MRSLLLLAALLTVGCCIDEPAGMVQGLRPIYLDDAALGSVATAPAQNVKVPDVTLYHEDLFLISEKHRGIHVYDNADPTAPVKVLFWSIPGMAAFALEDQTLYVDNAKSLLVIDISDPAAIAVRERLSDIYPGSNTDLHPAQIGVFFECVDPALGVVVGWESQLLDNPNCRR